jgi:hypothetical protein
MTNLGLLYALGDFLPVPLCLARLATHLLLEVDVAGFQLSAVYYAVERGETNGEDIVLNDVVGRLTSFNERGDNLINLDEFSESKIESGTTILEKFSVLRVSLISVIHLLGQIAFNDFPVELRTDIAYMWRFCEPLAFNNRVFRAPLVACCLAPVAAKSATVAPATGVMDITGVKL